MGAMVQYRNPWAPSALAWLYGDEEWVTGNAESAMRDSLDYVQGVHFCNINDLGEAIKHAMFQALATVLYGEGTAAQLGDNHEDYLPPLTPHDVLDAGRDQFNNAVGRRIGSEILNMPGYGMLSWNEVVKQARARVYKAAKNGELIFCLQTGDKRLTDATERERQRKAQLEESWRRYVEFMRQGTTG